MARVDTPTKTSLPLKFQWSLIFAGALLLLAFPALGKLPGFALGWAVRFFFQRTTELVQNFVQTFQAVLGDLLVEAGDSVKQLATDITTGTNSHVGGLALAFLSWKLARRQ